MNLPGGLHCRVGPPGGQCPLYKGPQAAPQIDAVFIPDLVGYPSPMTSCWRFVTMDLVLIVLVVTFFVLSGWLISALDRL